MTIKTADRVFETSNTGGTGTINLAGPITGFRSFVTAVGDGAEVPYLIDNGIDWEIGFGTVTAGSPNTLSRDAILYSSNSNAAVNFDGTLNVRLTALSSTVIQRDQGLNFTDLLGAGGGTANAHTVTMPVTPIAYTDGMIVMYRATVANTGAMTINVDNLGARPLKVNGADPASGLIGAGQLVVAIYKASNNTFETINIHPAPDLSPYATIASLGTAAYEDVETVREIPSNSKSADYTLVLSDAGKHILHPSADATARTFTIPANSDVAFPIGTAVTFVNQDSAGVVTIAITTDTMRLAGAGTTGSRTLAANGVATALKITSTEWIISGTGLS